MLVFAITAVYFFDVWGRHKLRGVSFTAHLLNGHLTRYTQLRQTVNNEFNVVFRIGRPE